MASRIGITNGGMIRIITRNGSAVVDARHDDRQKPGTLALPNGLGMLYPNSQGHDVAMGVSVNELTGLDNKDKFVGTPFHKYVPARLERLS